MQFTGFVSLLTIVIGLSLLFSGSGLSSYQQLAQTDVAVSEEPGMAVAEEQDPGQAMDSETLQNLRNSINDLQGNIKDARRVAKKMPDLLGKLDVIQVELSGFLTILNGSDEDAKEDVRDKVWQSEDDDELNPWQRIDYIRFIAESRSQIPRDRKEAARTLKQLLKSGPLIQSMLGMDVAAFQNIIQGALNTYDQVLAMVNNNQISEAKELMSEKIHENHPGPVYGLIGDSSRWAGDLKKLKNPDLNERVKGLLQPAYAIVYSGEFQGLGELFWGEDGNQGQINRLIEEAYRNKNKKKR